MSDYDIAIIGAGVAGLTAGFFAAKGGAKTIIIDSLGVGGQVMTVDRIENMPGLSVPLAGYELGPVLQEQASEAGVEFSLGQITSITQENGAFLLLGDEEIRARAVIIAAGSSKRRLDVPGEDRLEGKGVSHCASCDGPFFKGKPVCVVGGGDAACDEALVLAEHASQVFLIHRGAALRAQAFLVERVAAKQNIRILLQTELEEILGDAVVTGVRIHGEGGQQTQAVEGVFIYAGLVPNTGFLGDLVRLSENDQVETDLGMRTSCPGIFAAGDIRVQSAGLLAASAGDGATAARNALRFLARSI